jgi:hypothetical protein
MELLILLVQRQGELLSREEIAARLWRIDLDSGAEQQLREFSPDFDVRDFDISPDGREVVLERVQERSNAVLIDLGKR